MTIVITNCSKRKRVPLDDGLHARDLPAGLTTEVARVWTERLGSAASLHQASTVYGGRAFVEASAAAMALDADLLIVSAGLGLVNASTAIPAYSLTTAKRDLDSVMPKIDGSSAAWWDALEARSPFHSNALDYSEGAILVALPAGYLQMVAPTWASWPEERLGRLRLFTKESVADLPEALAHARMPYDDRLDAVGVGWAGTQSDFAQRALGHFATLPAGASIDADRTAVSAALDGFEARVTPVRTRATDAEIQAAIEAEWDMVRGRSGLMLRHLRDTRGLACEQSRFAGLFRETAKARKARNAKVEKGPLL